MPAPSSPRPSGASKSLASLARGLDVLLAVQQAPAITFTELREQTSIAKATLVRILKTLVECGWVTRHPHSGRYSSVALPRVADEPAGLHRPLQDVAEPLMERLQAQVPWPVDLAVRSGTSMLILDAGVTSGLGLAPNYRLLGSRPPMLRSSLGRCYIGFCPKDEREQLLALLRKSTRDIDRVQAEPHAIGRLVAQTRRLGYALRDAQQSPAHSVERYGALSVPVMVGERVVACISCSWLPGFSSADQIVHEQLGHLQATASLIGQAIT